MVLRLSSQIRIDFESRSMYMYSHTYIVHLAYLAVTDITVSYGASCSRALMSPFTGTEAGYNTQVTHIIIMLTYQTDSIVNDVCICAYINTSYCRLPSRSVQVRQENAYKKRIYEHQVQHTSRSIGYLATNIQNPTLAIFRVIYTRVQLAMASSPCITLAKSRRRLE